jgi:sec-independent protein translocase protein TatA
LQEYLSMLTGLLQYWINTKNMGTLLFLSGFRGSEIIIVALLILLLFGGKKIPELMKGIGKGVKSFKEGLKDVGDEIKADATNSDNKKDTDKKKDSDSQLP